jgi:hypothetical protein
VSRVRTEPACGEAQQPAPPRNSTVPDVGAILAAQRSAGNQAVARLLARKPVEHGGGYRDDAIGAGVDLALVREGADALWMRVVATGTRFIWRTFADRGDTYELEDGTPIEDPTSLATMRPRTAPAEAEDEDEDEVEEAADAEEEPAEDADASSDEDAEPVEVGRRTKAVRAHERATRGIHHEASIESGPRRFFGTEETPVADVSTRDVLALLEDAARSPHEVLRRNAMHVLKQPTLQLLAGPHRYGLGSEDMAADPKLHITLRAGNTTYHLRISSGRPPASLLGKAREEAGSDEEAGPPDEPAGEEPSPGTPRRKKSPYEDRGIADRRIVQITPDASGLAGGDEAAPAAGDAAPAAGAADGTERDALREHIERRYAAKLVDMRHRYERPDAENYRLVLFTLRNTDPVVKRALKADDPFREEVLAAAEKNKLHIPKGTRRTGHQRKPPRRRH